MFDFSIVTGWIYSTLRGLMPAWAALAIEYVLIGVVILLVYALIALSLIYMERKVCGAFQCRLGPNRVGPMGIFQAVADMIKMLIKELIHIRNSDKFLFKLAPFIMITASVMAFGCLPFGRGLHVLDFNIGIFLLLSVSAVSILGVLLAGWASNNKFSMIGAMRSGAQMISYELSLGISMLTMVMLAGTMSLSGIVEAQADGWFLFKGHIPALIAFIVYLIAGNAETNRGPFDLPEAESELTAGFHTEYSGLQFGFFYLAEYLNLFIVAGVAATVFLGGWMPLHIPGWEGFNAVMDYIPSVVWFFGKTYVMIFVLMWFKWTFPRLRVDQILALEWKYLLPIGLFNLMLMAVIVIFGLHF